MPATTFVHTSGGTVNKLRTITQFMIQPDPSDPDWLRLRPTFLSDKQLFAMLQAIWPAIVGAEYRKFALVHCLGGSSAGVWFHLLPNDDYEAGCFEVPSL
jgi:hypothetical protein